MKMRVNFIVFWALTVSLFLCGTTLTMAGETYTLGIIPQQKPSVIKKNWDPVIAHIAKKTGITFKLVPTPDIPAFMEKLNNGEYDFAYTNPYSYVQVSESVGYKAFANAKNKKIKGIFVVKADSPYQSREDLAGKKVSFPKGAFAADVLLRAGLKQAGISVADEYTRTHDDGYVAVARGTVEASGGVNRTFNATNPGMKKNLRVLWTTPGYTPHAFAAHPKISPGVVNKVQSVMVEMSNDPNLVNLFKAMKIKQGVQAAQDSDWNDVKELAPFLKSVASK